jgi:hypothetical protein
MEQGETIAFEKLPLAIQGSISKELKSNIIRIYKDWCDSEADRYYINTNAWLLQNDIKMIGGFSTKKIGLMRSYVRIEPSRYHGLTIVYTIYKN